MRTEGYILAIDPDVDKSGFALLDCKSHTFIRLEALTFTEAVRFFDALAADAKMYPLTVVIEDSDMSVNWHYRSTDSKGAVAAIGRSVGMCHATFRHLKEFAESVGLEVKCKAPLKKMWRGPNGKITHDELAVFVSDLPKRTNGEMRDAALLGWDEAGFPIRISMRK